MGVPGWPEFASWTASIASVRMVFTHSSSISILGCVATAIGLLPRTAWPLPGLVRRVPQPLQLIEQRERRAFPEAAAHDLERTPESALDLGEDRRTGRQRPRPPRREAESSGDNVRRRTRKQSQCLVQLRFPKLRTDELGERPGGPSGRKSQLRRRECDIAERDRGLEARSRDVA